ncbi:CinA family protein [Afifella pfennigii]|uniref:CinA family protein n=1 Tax=Afifella pfennigii TaxID=209897 RepID=UPI00068B1DC5|nr:CinA family protein [Afifella pfennigii]
MSAAGGSLDDSLDGDIAALSAALLDLCQAKGLRIATAESCTGGGVAAALTDIAGSSAVFERGFVTYSNEAKAELLSVPQDVLARHGAVSEEVARAMVAGTLARAPAELAVAVTGVAGPGGGTAQKPVGLVWFAAARRGAEPISTERRFNPELGRSGIRTASVAEALKLLMELARTG